MSHNNIADPVEEDTTPRRHETQPANKSVLSFRTTPEMPIMVDLDALLGQSEDDQALFECRKRTPKTLARPAHSLPRLRAVPCTINMLGVAASPTNTDVKARATANPNLLVPKYKDPPGFDNVTDFGTTRPKVFSNPASLRPKKHRVSFEWFRVIIYNYFVKKICQLIACDFIMRRAPSAAGQESGSCTRASVARSLASPRWCEQQILQRAKDTCATLQECAAVHIF